MKKILVNVGLTDRNYSACVIIGDGIAVATGKTFAKLKSQMEEAVEFHIESLREDGDPVPDVFNSEYEFVYQFDVESLLKHCKKIFTDAALEKLTGINHRQLQRYADGTSKPRKSQVKKIENALHGLGKELLAVEL